MSTTAEQDRSAPFGRVLRLLPAVTLAAVLTITASAEFELARTVLALPPAIAWALPVAVDSYVLAALHSRRDVAAALTVMSASLGAAMVAHLATAALAPGEPLPRNVAAPAAAVIMSALVVVAWRVHVLVHAAHVSAPSPATSTAPTAAPAVAAPLPGTTAAVSVHSDAPKPLRREPAAEQSVRAGRPRAARPAVDDLRPVPAATPGHGESRDQAAADQTSKTDDQILAEIAGTTPSMRSLMRAYAIGQARATRIARAAASAPPQVRATAQITREHSSTTRPSSHQQNDQHDQKQHDNTTEPSREIQQQPIPTITTEKDQDHEQEATPDEPRSEDQNTHTCITDRVGEFSAPPELPQPHFSASTNHFQEA